MLPVLVVSVLVVSVLVVSRLAGVSVPPGVSSVPVVSELAFDVLEPDVVRGERGRGVLVVVVPGAEARRAVVRAAVRRAVAVPRLSASTPSVAAGRVAVSVRVPVSVPVAAEPLSGPFEDAIWRSCSLVRWIM